MSEHLEFKIIMKLNFIKFKATNTQ